MSSKRTCPAPSALQRIGVFFLFLFGVEVAALLAFGGPWPATRRGWILLLVLGPPVYLLSEWLLGRVFARVEKLDSEPKGRLLSWRRVLVALIVFLVLISLVGLVLWFAGVDLASFQLPRAAQHLQLAADGCSPRELTFRSSGLEKQDCTGAVKLLAQLFAAGAEGVPGSEVEAAKWASIMA